MVGASVSPRHQCRALVRGRPADLLAVAGLHALARRRRACPDCHWRPILAPTGVVNGPPPVPTIALPPDFRGSMKATREIPAFGARRRRTGAYTAADLVRIMTRQTDIFEVA